MDLDEYKRSRLVRSSVEREFSIGEAVSAPSRVAPDVVVAITRA